MGLHICNQRLYLLSQLKKQGLTLAKLQTVFDAIVLSRILYGAPAWSCYAQSMDIDCIQKMLMKAKRWQIISQEYDIVDLFKDCDMSLSKAVLNTKHSLNHLFHVKQQNFHCMTLRPRGHNFSLPKFKYQYTKNSFVNRSLFLNV